MFLRKGKQSQWRSGNAKLGASIYDVRTQGGETGLGKADIVGEVIKVGCVKMQTRGEGVKNFCGRHKWKDL